jgi:endonuclease/exonuclease/phosphatase family metal-dependent hydrolase
MEEERVRLPTVRRAAVLGAAVAAACAAVPATAPAKPQDLKVMVRNVYLGADLIPLAGAANQQDFEAAAAARFGTVQTNDFAARAKAIAKEIRRHKPDLVGLQEAAVWRRGPDGVKDGSATPASDIVYDSTDLLLKALADRGQRYRVVAGRDWFDYEAPTALGFDVRLTQRDVILVRRGSKVKLGTTFRGGYEKTFDVPTVVGLAAQKRGWVGVDGKLAGRSFRFVTTHLEAYVPATAEQQMDQLLAGPLKSKRRQAILVGDFNSDPATAGADRGADRRPSAYAAALEAGFKNPFPRRSTCCFAEDLRATGTALSQWIDHIVVRPRIKLLRSSIVGSTAAERSGGLWPSDHAGIAGTLRLSR